MKLPHCEAEVASTGEPGAARSVESRSPTREPRWATSTHSLPAKLRLLLRQNRGVLSEVCTMNFSFLWVSGIP